MNIRDYFYLNNTIYLDNAASTLKLKSVVDEMEKVYFNPVNVKEEVRELLSKFLKVPKSTIKFVKGTTNALNIISQTLEKRVSKEDEIVLSISEHHSNILPWQNVCKNRGCKIKYLDIDEKGNIIQEYSDKMKILSLAHVSNALGVIHPIEKIAKEAKKRGAYVVIDGAQAPSHINLDLSKIDCDFYTFSGHKMYGPTGIGILYDKNNLVEETIDNNIAIAGLGKAVEFLLSNSDALKKEEELLNYATNALKKEGIKIFGDNSSKVGIISLDVPGVHPHDVASFLNDDGISIRAGHHCAQLLMKRLGVPATCRISFGIYNKQEDIDKAVKSIKKVKEFFNAI